MEGFNDELEAFKERVRGRAKARIERAMREYEEEERQKRLGPGGLDPVDVYESLPPVSAVIWGSNPPLLGVIPPTLGSNPPLFGINPHLFGVEPPHFGL